MMWCKEKATLGHCGASSRGLGFVLTFTHGFAPIYPADRAHRGHAVAAVLDGGDRRLPKAAQLRAGVFLLVPGAVSLLQRIAFDSECADLLRAAADRAAGIRDRHHL